MSFSDWHLRALDPVNKITSNVAFLGREEKLQTKGQGISFIVCIFVQSYDLVWYEQYQIINTKRWNNIQKLTQCKIIQNISIEINTDTTIVAQDEAQ